VACRAVDVGAVPVLILCLLLRVVGSIVVVVVSIGGVLLVRRASLTPKGIDANASTGGRSNNSHSKTFRDGDIIVGIQYRVVVVVNTMYSTINFLLLAHYCEAQHEINTPQRPLLR
jgi:hypothetical protein